jgi:diguanylate cyclase (GGDEF)-like protein
MREEYPDPVGPHAHEEGHELEELPDENSPSDAGVFDSVTLKRSVLSWLGIFVKDFEEPEKSFPNRYWIQYGHTLPEMLDGRWLHHIHPEDRPRVASFLEDAVRNHGEAETQRYRVRDAEGRWHWVISTGIVESYDDRGKPLRYVGIDYDVTRIQLLEEELRAARTRAEEEAKEAEALRTAGAVITSNLSRGDAAREVGAHIADVISLDEIIIFEQAEREMTVLDGPVENLLDRTPWGVEALHEVLRRRSPNIIREPTRADTFWLLVPLVLRNDVLGVIALSRRRGKPFQEREIRFTTAISDYLSLAMVNARMYEEMTRLATVDLLSNLPTRRAFFERANRKLQAVPEGSVHTAIILDIDFFKSINDDFGHIIGDEAIRKISEVFRVHLRDRDILCRYGGEEFCAFLPNTTVQEGRLVAERICDIVRDTEIDGVTRPVTVSLGVASRERSTREDQLSLLLNAADTALYEAKRAGRDRVCVAD